MTHTGICPCLLLLVLRHLARAAVNRVVQGRVAVVIRLAEEVGWENGRAAAPAATASLLRLVGPRVPERWIVAASWEA